MRTRERLIHIRLTEEEHQRISEQAQKMDMPTAPYIRMVALNPNIIKLDYSAISEHTKEIAEIRNSINRLVFTIDAQNYYLPKEIETIVQLMNDIFQSENKLLETVCNLEEKIEAGAHFDNKNSFN